MSIESNNPSYEPYVVAIKEQIEQHVDSLNQLSERLHQANLSFIERSAAERNLQVLIESALGCSKHYLKMNNKPVPAEARACIERVYEIAKFDNPAINEMRGAIGMRNAIIHDYLNLDWSKLELVIKEKNYLAVVRYIDEVLERLEIGNE